MQYELNGKLGGEVYIHHFDIHFNVTRNVVTIKSKKYKVATQNELWQLVREEKAPSTSFIYPDWVIEGGYGKKIIFSAPHLVGENNKTRFVNSAFLALYYAENKKLEIFARRPYLGHKAYQITLEQELQRVGWVKVDQVTGKDAGVAWINPADPEEHVSWVRSDPNSFDSHHKLWLRSEDGNVKVAKKWIYRVG